jgi:hypothetical protein
MNEATFKQLGSSVKITSLALLLLSSPRRVRVRVLHPIQPDPALNIVL